MGQRPDQLGGSNRAWEGRAADDAAATPETEAVREEIEQTRADMSSTIEAIQDRLDPEVISEQAKETAHDVTDYAVREAKEAAREVAEHAIGQAREAVRDMTGQAKTALREATIGKVETMAHTASETAGGWRSTFTQTVKAHPLPAAIAGLSLGWLFLNRSSGPASPQAYPARSYASTSTEGYPGGFTRTGPDRPASSGLSSTASDVQGAVGQVADRAQQKAGQAVDQVQETAGQVVGQVQDTAGEMVDQVQEQAARAQGFLQRQLEERPLVVGAIVVGLGSVLAGMVPPTPREDQLMGQARDRLMGSAKELTQDTMHRVGQVVDEAQSAVQQEAKAQSLVP